MHAISGYIHICMRKYYKLKYSFNYTYISEKKL